MNKALYLLTLVLLCSCTKTSYKDPEPVKVTVTKTKINLVKIQVDVLAIQTEDLEVEVEENVKKNTQLGTLKAKSSTDQTLTYHLTQTNVPDAISIDANTGAVKVNNPSLFDYETNPEIQATYAATDGKVKNFGIILIKLKDVKEVFMFTVKLKYRQDSTFTIPTDVYYQGQYDYTVDWGDGKIEEHLKGRANHRFPPHDDPNDIKDKFYQVKITGDLPAFGALTQVQREKVVSFDQWGEIQWRSLENIFSGWKYMEYKAKDAPILDDVKSMNDMFSYCEKFDADLSSWKVDHVEDMGQMFSNAVNFNGDITGWDVSHVKNMSWMFRNAKKFDQDISRWEVFNLKSAYRMFEGTEAFDQDISVWNLRSIKDVQFMFKDAKKFDQDLSSWKFKYPQVSTKKAEFAPGSVLKATHFPKFNR